VALRFVNLTPYAVRVWAQAKPDRETVFPASGKTVRVKFSSRVVTSSDRVELRHVEPISVSDLPTDVARDLRYIVSESVFRLVEDRKDFVHPASVIRDPQGKVAAYLFLAAHTKAETQAFYATDDLLKRPVKPKPLVEAGAAQGAPQ